MGAANPIASDIMFTNPVFSKFFQLGQVIETMRGKGIFQPAIDEAVQLVQDGEWVSNAVDPDLERSLTIADPHISRRQSQPAATPSTGGSDQI
jgi:hypothetical protein